jgi:Mg2+ and Co2+ transporter CorA
MCENGSYMDGYTPPLRSRTFRANVKPKKEFRRPGDGFQNIFNATTVPDVSDPAEVFAQVAQIVTELQVNEIEDLSMEEIEAKYNLARELYPVLIIPRDHMTEEGRTALNENTAMLANFIEGVKAYKEGYTDVVMQ